ncbi:hypothetical protein JOD20_001795 [Herpetosiphon giganteus]|nr:hypothetical protein [Herpetosiphon giganteus]
MLIHEGHEGHKLYSLRALRGLKIVIQRAFQPHCILVG